MFLVDGAGVAHDLSANPKIADLLDLLTEDDRVALGGLPDSVGDSFGSDASLAAGRLADSLHGTFERVGTMARLTLAPAPGAQAVPRSSSTAKDGVIAMRAPVSRTATYEFTGRYWRLATLDVRTRQGRRTGVAPAVMGMTYSNVRVHREPGATVEARSDAAQAALIDRIASSARERQVRSIAVAPPVQSDDAACSHKTLGAFPGGGAIVLQHGLASGDCTWTPFEPRVSNGLQVKSVERWSTSNLSSINT